jgi:hypothetical protein
VTGVTDPTTELLDDAEAHARRDRDFDAVISLIGAVRELKREHDSAAHMAATNDPGLLGRVTELERLTGMLVKSVGVLASSPQPRATGQPPRDTGAGLFIAALDREDRPATYGPVPSPYGRPSPAWAVDVCRHVLSASSPNRTDSDFNYAVEYVAVEYVHGEPTLRVQVSGVLYRFHAPDVLSNKGDA